jgi:hypothetical protein
MQRRSFALALACAATGAFAQRTGKKAAAPVPTAPASPALGDRLLELRPKAPTRAGETHSALAVSTLAFGGSYRFAGQACTLQQLRTGSRPNAWEVAWAFWNFADNDHLYYFILKPNGWEVGKRDPRYAVPGVNDGQKIMATGESVKLAIGQWYEFDIRVTGAEADIYVNGAFVCHFKDTDTAPLLGGRVGLYCEDALCRWNNIGAPVADGFEMEPVQVFADGSQLTNWRIPFLGYGSGGIVAIGD